MLCKDAVAKGTLDLIKRLMADEELGEFNLIGGTALALKIGHRESIDIDLFCNSSFNAAWIAEYLSHKYSAQRVNNLKNAVFCFIEDVKIDLIAHQYPLLRPVELVEGIRMLSLNDIAAMKLHAVVNNGTRLKDFADIYFLLERLAMSDILRDYEIKYAETNTIMARTALLYHNDIDFNVPIAYITNKIEWSLINARINEALNKPDKLFPKTKIKKKKR